MEEDPNQSGSGIYLFGRDIMTVPCLRKSALTGLSGCIASTLLSFLFTSNGTKSARIGFWTFIGVAFPYWFLCRDQEYQKEIQIYQLKKEIQEASQEEYIITDSLEFGPETSV